jgi:REP element-mobilizing transposase RayT
MPSTYTSLYIHIVFAAHRRKPLILDDWRQDLHNYIGGTINAMNCKTIIVNGVADHVHILVGLRPTHVIADLVREVKKASSIWAAARDPGFSWQTGYAAFTLSANDLPIVRAYIANQEAHHRQQNSLEELESLLREHGIAPDSRFLD